MGVGTYWGEGVELEGGGMLEHSTSCRFAPLLPYLHGLRVFLPRHFKLHHVPPRPVLVHYPSPYLCDEQSDGQKRDIRGLVMWVGDMVRGRGA